MVGKTEKIIMPKSRQKTIKEYKEYVSKKLEELTPIFLKISQGDFSIKIEIPEKEDEFTPLIVSLKLILEDLEELDKENKEKTDELERAKVELEEKIKGKTKELEESRISLVNTLKEVEDSRKALMNILKDVDDSKKALVNILEDVEDARGRAEEEKNKTLTIINNFADGLFVFNEENKLSLVNHQGEAFFDVKARDLFGRPILELNTFPTLEPLINLLGEEIKGVFRKELSIKENLTLEISTIPMAFGEEKLGTLVILHDITREKIIERMKTEFVSLSAHQLRTPLSAIKWTLRMLLDGDLGEITKEQREFIEKTYTSNERMIALINDLLDITRIEEGRYLYRPILTEIEPVIQFVINSCKEEIERKKIILDFKKSEEKLPKVMIDVEKIRLAVQNILDNALKYTLSNGQIAVAVRRVEKEIEISVKDSGIGIPKDQQARIFTKFFRGANVLRMETDGSGLGLFITKNIIEAHGGKIWFESKEGDGTTFYFTLPIREEFEGFLKEF